MTPRNRWLKHACIYKPSRQFYTRNNPEKIGYGFPIFEVCKVIVGYILIIQPGPRGADALLGAVTSVIIAYTLQLIFYLRLTPQELQGKIMHT